MHSYWSDNDYYYYDDDDDEEHSSSSSSDSILEILSPVAEERERLRGRCMGVVRWLGRVMNFCFRGARRGDLQIKTLY